MLAPARKAPGGQGPGHVAAEPVRGQARGSMGLDAQRLALHLGENHRLFERRRIEKALDEACALSADQIVLVKRLHALDRGLHAERIGEADEPAPQEAEQAARE